MFRFWFLARRSLAAAERPRFFLTLSICVLTSGCAATDAAVGVTTYSVPQTSTDTGFSARIWYPGVGGAPERMGASRIRPGYIAVPDAKIALSGRAPLVVLAHGSGGSADSMAWLATALVRMGAVVVAANHPASAGGDPERASILDVWTQPEDIRRLLDHLFASDWQDRLDSGRVASVGFSLGGATAMLLAGAQLQMERFPTFCAANDDGACRAFRRHFRSLDAAFFERANASQVDARVRAVVAIAPGFSESLDTESLELLTTPVLMIAGARDQQLPPRTHVHPIRHLLGPMVSYTEIANAQHFSFLPLCGEGAIEVLAETNEEFVCQEMGGQSREDIHAEVIETIGRYLQEKGVIAH